MSFWDVVWLIFISFAFVAYLMVLFSIVTDLFRDKSTGGLVKGVWIVALIFLPVLTALVYLIARGDGMAERSFRREEAAMAREDAYLADTAASGAPAGAPVGTPVDQVAKAKDLLDSGAISRTEFESLKARALT